jgi:hypothetical protein
MEGPRCRAHAPRAIRHYPTCRNGGTSWSGACAQAIPHHVGHQDGGTAIAFRPTRAYDAIARLRDANLEQMQRDEQKRPDRSVPASIEESSALVDIGHYITLGPLGTALIPRSSKLSRHPDSPSDKRPRVLLIDEIDKSDVDLPNDLLHVFEEGEFAIPELVRVAEMQPNAAVRFGYRPAAERRVHDYT